MSRAACAPACWSRAPSTLMDELGAGERLHREGMPDPRLDIRFSGGIIHIDLPVLTPGKIVTVYGQQEVVKDLIAARLVARRPDPVRGRGDARRRPRRQAADDPFQARGQRRDARMRHRRRLRRLPRHLPRRHPGACCSRSMTAIYPFGWLGILAEAKPFPEMSYSNHERGFALASRRSPKLSRLYVQCAADEDLAAGPDRRIWDELHTRLYDKDGGELHEGPILQKGVIAAARLCRGADAARPDVSRRRRRPHRAADRRQGPQSRRRRRARAVARADRVLPHRRDRTARPLFRHLPQAGVEGRALFQLHDVAAAPLRDAQRRSSAACSRPSWNMSRARSRRGPRSRENYVGLPFEED